MVHFALLLRVSFSRCLALCPAGRWRCVFIRPRASRSLHIREPRGDTTLSLAFILSIVHLRLGSRGSLDPLDLDGILDSPSYKSNVRCQMQTVGALRIEVVSTETESELQHPCSRRKSSSKSSRVCEQSKLVAKRMAV